MNTPVALLLGLVRRTRGEFDATTVILIILAAIAGYMVYEFIRENRGRSSIALVGAIIGHLLLLLFLSLDIPGRIGCGIEVEGTELIEFEVAELDEPEEEPEPEQEPEEEPEEVEPEQTPTEIKPKEPPPKPRAKKAEPNPQPETLDPAPPKRWDLTAANGNGPVVVPQGSGGEYGGTGKPDSKGKGKGNPAGDPKGDEDGTAAKWEPRSELYIKTMPDPVKVPKIDCPATAELGVVGEVVLKVEITREGKVRGVRVVKGIGQGCNEVAIKALKQARFKPAVATNGKPVDFELRYEYAFTVNN